MKVAILIIAALVTSFSVQAGEAPSAEASTTAKAGTEAGTSPSTPPRTGRHLFILSGQSNMYHMKTNTFSSVVSKAFGEDNVTIVKSAKRGAPIRTWDKDYKWPENLPVPQGRANKRAGKEAATREEYVKGFGKLYVKLMEAVKKHTEGKTYDTVTFVWMQGESDTSQKLNLVDLYFDSFNRILARIRKDLNIKSINVVIGRLSDYGMNNPNWVKMRELQVKYAEANPNCEWVNCDDLNDVTKNGEKTNGLHYTEEGYKTLEQRFAEKAIKLINNK